MDVHELIECGSPEEAQRLFSAALVAQTGQLPAEKFLRDIEYWFNMSHVVNELLQGSLILRTVGGVSQIDRIGDYK